MIFINNIILKFGTLFFLPIGGHLISRIIHKYMRNGKYGYNEPGAIKLMKKLKNK